MTDQELQRAYQRARYKTYYVGELREKMLEKKRAYKKSHIEKQREYNRKYNARKRPPLALQRLDKERVPKRPMQYNTTTSDELHDKLLRWAFTQWRKYISGRTPGSIKLMHEADREYYAKRVRNYDAITLALENELDIGSRNMIYQKQRTIEQDIYNWATNHKSGV